MSDQNEKSLATLLQRLVGRPPIEMVEGISVRLELPNGGLGYSQFNEAMLALGYPRVSEHLFEFIRSGTTEYVKGNSISNLKDLEIGVERVRHACMLTIGSLTDGFSVLCNADESLLNSTLDQMAAVNFEVFSRRHEPSFVLQEIDASETHLLGYISGAAIDAAIQKDPTDKDAQIRLSRRDELRRIGYDNHIAYLFSDHLDVYVATSMRLEYDFVATADFCKAVFDDSRITDLNLRYFDPTQAYCEDRIDKGLSEALMLRRAKCTIYLIQESDTLGKDSELASTLAQGKSVIAYVPRLDHDDAVRVVRDLVGSEDSAEAKARMIDLLKKVAPDLLWSESPDQQLVREWLDAAEGVSDQVVDLAARLLAVSYDKRAKTLREQHPLAIQVHLETGVAVGVLVARTTDEVVRLLRGVMTNGLDFYIREDADSGASLLIESVSDSVFRVVSGDRALTHAFWQFYGQR